MSAKTYPKSHAQYKELARLKSIKQICLILGIIFSIIGLISMCDNPIEMKENSVANQTVQLNQS